METSSTRSALKLRRGRWHGLAARARRAVVVSAQVSSIALAVFLVFGGAQRASSALAVSLDPTAPVTPVTDWFGAFIDRTAVPITVSAGWQRLHRVVPAWQLQSDRSLWVRMRFENWDTVPEGLRRESLSKVFDRYEATLRGPAVWAGMDAHDWDLVPQPVRAMAVLRMIDWRVAAAVPGGAFGLSPQDISDTIAAIVMVESWFEHRAVNVNENGERDLGLSQASASCRSRMEELHRQGAVEISLAEEDYFDPWKASAVATTWFLRMLDQARGDVGLAVRAYHRGMIRARRGAGRDYLEQVEAKKGAFIRNSSAPPSWRFAFERARHLTPHVLAAAVPPLLPPLLPL